MTPWLMQRQKPGKKKEGGQATANSFNVRMSSPYHRHRPAWQK